MLITGCTNLQTRMRCTKHLRRRQKGLPALSLLVMMASETLEVCKICFNKSSHNSSPTLTPQSMSVVDAVFKWKCLVCKQPWISQKIAKDSRTQKWVAIRTRPKINPKIDYQLCVSVQNNKTCQKGQTVCTYAHSKVELKEWNKERLQEIRPVPVLSGSGPFQLCKHVQNTGTCIYGQQCNFAHSEKELEKWNSSGAHSEKELEKWNSSGTIRQRPPKIPVNGFKLCRNVITGRRCCYGSKCTFAHSNDELQQWNKELAYMLYLSQRRIWGNSPPRVSQHLGPQSGDLDEFVTEPLWERFDGMDGDWEEGIKEQMDFAQQMRMRVKYAHQEEKDLPGLEVHSWLSHGQCIAACAHYCMLGCVLLCMYSTGHGKLE